MANVRVEIIWSDNELTKSPFLQPVANALRQRSFTTPMGHKVTTVIPDGDPPRLITDATKVVDTVRHYWKASSSNQDNLRLWLADIVFEGESAGLEHIQRVLDDSSILTDMILVISEKPGVEKEITTKYGGSLRVQLKQVDAIRTLDDLLSEIAKMVDERLGRQKR
jgi:hypothetical protein